MIVGPTLVDATNIMRANCPNCEKEVDAIKISNERKSIPESYDTLRYTIHILGCPKCKNVFFEEEIDPEIKRKLNLD